MIFSTPPPTATIGPHRLYLGDAYAIRAGKTFTGIEHNPKHFETAIRRISATYEEGQRS